MFKKLISQTGFAYFPIALIARLPFAMMVVGVLTLVVVARDSLLLAGFNSALVGAGTAIFGPLIGASADRFGQRKTLLLTGFLNALFSIVFVFVVWSDVSIAIVYVFAFLIGASAPQVSAMSRSRLVGFINNSFSVKNKDRALSSVMAYESTVDEIVFVFGPFLVGVLAVWLGSGAPVIFAAALTALFVSLFALHPSSKPLLTSAQRSEVLAPLSELFGAKVLVVVVGIFGMGLFFGSMLTSLTAFMQEIGNPEKTGILYGVMGLGSAVLALSVAFFPPSFTKRWRWLLFASVMFIGALVLQSVSTQAGMIVALLILGLGVGPILVTQYSFGADRSPVGRDATLMTILGSGIVVGQSLSSAVTGWLSEKFSADTLFYLPLTAVILLLVSGLINFFLTPGGEALSKRTSTV